MEFIDLKSQQESIKIDLDKRIGDVLTHGKYIMGPEISELEEELKQYTKSKHCITVSSGTEALLISLMAIGIKPGDEIITTPFTWVSTAEVIALLGAIPVFADVEEDTCNINVENINNLITSKTKAIMPVSLYGQPSDMIEINEIAKKKNLLVIEDAAQSFGSTYNNNASCNLSKIGCTSFFPSKPLGCYGDGGAIFTDQDDIAQAAREIRLHGQEKKHWYTRIGVGGRMDTIQAAIVLAKLTKFDWEVEKRISIGHRYNIAFDDMGIERVQQRTNRTSVFAQYTIMINNRDNLINFLKEKKIPSAVHYSHPINLSPAYKKYCKGNTPISNRLSKKVLSIPMHPYLKNSEQDFIINSIKEFIT